jgi:thiosulfate dehydrogenase (quinone) large subunit
MVGAPDGSPPTAPVRADRPACDASSGGTGSIVPDHGSEPLSGGADRHRSPVAQPAGSETGSTSMWSITRPDGSVATGWFLLPLRLFIGVTFLYAGLQKLADPQFLRKTSPTSIYAQLIASSRSSPIHALVSHLVSIAPGVGLLIAIGEVAIGLGVLVGLWMRVAAAAGMALSFSLFLAVSFHTTPYFIGSDIVFFFAWTPLVLAGAAGAPALDTWLADRPEVTPGRTVVSRRAVISSGALAGMAAAVVLCLGGFTALVGRLIGGTSTAGGGTVTLAGGGTATTTRGAGHPTSSPGTAIGPAAGVPLGGSASFTDPSTGDPALVIHQTAGDFVAFDAICPHQGCTVAYHQSSKIIACPCHGSEFDAKTGNVIRGPAATGLTPIRITDGPNGDLYVAS